MKEFDDVLRRATANISAEYFQLPVDGGVPIYRERVYCYELYHQMRCLWPKEGTDLRLNGEVDKKAHPVMSKLEMHLAIPDLLVHGPGYMARNFAVIEVKPQTADATGLRKDIQTLTEFRLYAKYERAIYLHYGHELSDNLLHALRTKAGRAKSPEIEIWFHKAPKEAAAQVDIIDGGG